MDHSSSDEDAFTVMPKTGLVVKLNGKGKTKSPKKLPEKFFEDEKKLVGQAKHAILEKHLASWLAMLCLNKYRFRQYTKVVYVDGFAGPGIYSNGDKGSPALAYELALTHKNLKPQECPYIFLIFVEKDESNCAKLFENLKQIRESEMGRNAINAKKVHYMVIQGEFAGAMKWILSKSFQFTSSAKRPFTAPKYLEEETACMQPFITKQTPLLVFIDPFGYNGAQMPMTLMREIQETTQKAEILINIMTGFIRRFLNLDSRTKPINLLIGQHETDNNWKTQTKILEASTPEKKVQYFLEFYFEELKKGFGDMFNAVFEMRDPGNRLLYHLVFATRHQKSFSSMKTAMNKISQDGEKFKFSSFNQLKNRVGEKVLPIEEIEEMITAKFNGISCVSGYAIIEFIRKSTNFVEHIRNPLKKALRKYRNDPYNQKISFLDMLFDFSNGMQKSDVTASTSNIINFSPGFSGNKRKYESTVKKTRGKKKKCQEEI